ncbi:MAG: alpha-amylase family glycosyl hydrolase [Flavobacteriaceae bacterium]|nr:alpha-amylase family glycosyl hydrolase [Flavobacteriaceae bacterium]
MKKFFWLCACVLVAVSCKTVQQGVGEHVADSRKIQIPFEWGNANVYFLLTDRFYNGDKTNDVVLGRTANAAVLRGFEGGDLRGVIEKLDAGYFSDLGITAIWMTPLVEQIHGYTDEGTGKTYPFHGYWTKDWTAIDPNWGTEADLHELVQKAHARGIRIVLDAVVNHTGPVTQRDGVFPADWVRTEPTCSYENYTTTIDCTLVKNLPDVLTESHANVELPEMLLEKWRSEGRLEKELSSLNTWFARTGYPRAPKYYIMKWLADYISKFGIDGYRVDTVKHTTEDVWDDFAKICQLAFDDYNAANPDKFMGDKAFFLVGEVYGYGIGQKLDYHFPDKKVNYFENGFPALINFDFKADAHQDYEALFSSYDHILRDEMKGNTVMNYLSSHDDGSPFDKNREMTWDSGIKLLLSPGISQIYYGDESARPLQVKGAEGDAHLRSFMNWEDLHNDVEIKSLHEHYQLLGKFRKRHLAVGMGAHKMLSAEPYWFARTYEGQGFIDKIVIGLDLETGEKEVIVNDIFADGTRLRDAYSGVKTQVKNGKIQLDTDFSVVLLEMY